MRLVVGRRRLVSLAASAVAALGVGVGPAASDPPTGNANVLLFTIECPGMEPFEVTVVGAVGFVEGQASRDSTGEREAGKPRTRRVHGDEPGAWYQDGVPRVRRARRLGVGLERLEAKLGSKIRVVGGDLVR